MTKIIRKITSFEGIVNFDASRPDGMPRKLLDISRIRSLGWEPMVSLEDGIMRTYDLFKNRLS